MKKELVHLGLYLAFSALALPVHGQSVVPGEMIVKFDTQPTQPQLLEIERSIGVDVDWRPLRHAPHAKGKPTVPHPLSHFRIATVAKTLALEPLCDIVEKLDGISLACENRIPEITYVPNDSSYSTQWAHQKIASEAGWEYTRGSDEIIIGIVDTGCLVTHQDLAPNIWVNENDPVNGIDDDNNGFVDDRHGWDFDRDSADLFDQLNHGTRVTGIAAARIDNNLGGAGVCNAKIITAKWVHTGGGDSPVAESIAYSVDNGARVVNLSLSALSVLPATQAAIEYANQNNVVVIASSGNSGNGVPNYPASDPTVITVGAITIDDIRAGFSNFGAHLDLVAPSPGIHTTNRNSDTSYDSVFGGTSAAAPHVVGLVALMLSVNPDLTPEEVRTAMTENADDFGDPGFDVFYGHGRINVGATIKAIAPLIGDVNLDGQINLLDVAPFVELLQSGTFQNEGDINRDGVVDLLDVSGFIDLLSI